MLNTTENKILRLLLSVGFSTTSLILAFTMSWLILSSQNFLYPIWHDVAGIGVGIDKFGPKNRFKTGFGDTSAEQRADLFKQINKSVHNHGDGLATIRYETPSSKGPQLLLREPEIAHLQDVANLIDILKFIVLINALLWLGLAYFVLKVKSRLLTWFSQFAGVSAFLLTVGLCVFAVGPVKVFNQLHIWIFPKDNQWFFYYQESLMSTLMLAPTLFGWIAAALVTLALPLFAVLIFITLNIEKRHKS